MASDPSWASRLIPEVHLDRVQLVARPWANDEIPTFQDFFTVADKFVRPQTSGPAYRRTRTLHNPRTHVQLFVQYQPLAPWLAPLKLTIVPDDLRDVGKKQFGRFEDMFRRTELLTIEFALDFPAHAGINRQFVLKYGVFGRSRRVCGRFDTLRYGTRRSATLVRAYWKDAKTHFRIEVQIQRPWLRARRLTAISDLPRICGMLWPQRVYFGRIDWQDLERHLQRHNRAHTTIPGGMPSNSLEDQMHHIRYQLGIANPRRFLRPLSVNRQIRKALAIWRERWETDQ